MFGAALIIGQVMADIERSKRLREQMGPYRAAGQSFIHDCKFISDARKSECKWCGAPKATSCCEYCRRA